MLILMPRLHLHDIMQWPSASGLNAKHIVAHLLNSYVLDNCTVGWRDGSVVKSTSGKPGMVVHTANFSTWKADSTQRVPGQPGLQRDPVSERNT